MHAKNLLDEKYIRSILDALPCPVLIVDKHLTIHDANSASKYLLGKDIETQLKRLCGDTLNCIHAMGSSGGCGTADYCSDCVLRQTSAAVSEGVYSFRRISSMTLNRKGKVREFCFLVSGGPLQYKEKKYVILTLEDITELSELRRIVPICSFCRKVRDDSDYWQEVEDYFLKFSNIRFSHGVCPDCAKEQYSDFQGE